MLLIASCIPASEPILPYVARSRPNLAEVLRPGDSVENRRRISAMTFVLRLAGPAILRSKIRLECNARRVVHGSLAQAAADEMTVPQIALAESDLRGPILGQLHRRLWRGDEVVSPLILIA